MTTFRVQHNKHNPYAIIDKGFLDNPNLTAKAKGIFAYLLSKPDNWRVHLNHLVTVFQDGHVAIRSGLKELQAAGYLVRAAIRNKLGQIVEWVINLYEAPQQSDYLTDKNGNWIVKPHTETEICQGELPHNHSVNKHSTKQPEFSSTKTVQPKSKTAKTQTVQASLPDDGFPHLAHPHVGDRSLTNNDIQQLNEVNNISLGEKEEIFELTDDSICSWQADLTQQQTESLTNPKDFLEEEYSAAISIKVESLKSSAELNCATKQSSHFTFNSWIPDGAWVINGKLDPNFVLWLATDWQKAYGGDISKKKADVLRHFKKHPANIAISWQQYRDEQHFRYSNAAMRMENGIEIKPDEQEKLLKHSRALTEDFPDDIHPIADIPETGREIHFSELKCALSEAQICEADRTLTTSNQTQSNNIEPVQDNAEIATSSNSTENEPESSKHQKIDIESNDADKLPSSIKNWSKGSFSMGKYKSTEREKLSELDELNAWLSDPILRKEVLPRVMNSRKYTLEYNEYGGPIRVVKIEEN